MGFITWLVVGGLIGWLASVAMKMDAEQDQLLTVIVGIVGAFVGGFLLGPLLGARQVIGGDYGPGALLASLAGAVVLLAIVIAFRRPSTR
jgi:uncharacterized membrane protein YeaQ/YmgE (transglycosylase-associated protein family)